MENYWALGLLAGFLVFWYGIAPRLPGLSKFT
jgi:hypothetical protein